MANHKFNSFISYSRAADDRLAPEIKSALQGFAKPWYKLKAISVFCDQTNLTANPDLWSSIEHNLKLSEFFIYLASPKAAQSKWVRKEIDFFHEKRSADNIIIVLTDGDIVWDDERNDFNWQLTNSFPKFDKKIFNKEPLWLDLRWIRKEQLSSRDPRFLDTIASLSSILRLIDKDALIGKDVEEHRKAKRFRLFSFLGLGLLTLFLLGATVLAVRSQRISQQRLVKTYNINGINLMENGDYTLALPWFIEALAIEENEDRKESYAFRIKNLLNQMPVLVQVWQKKSPVLKTEFINDSTILILTGPGKKLSGDYNCDESGPNGCNAFLQIISAKTGRDKIKPLNIRDGIQTFAFSSDKRFFACLSIQNILRLWDIQTGRMVWQKRIPVSEELFDSSIGFNPQNSFLFFVYVKGITIYNTEDGKPVNSYTKSDSELQGTTFSDNGETLLFVDNGLKVWNVKSNKLQSIVAPYFDELTNFQLSADRKHIALLGRINKQFGFSYIFAFAEMDNMQTPLFTKELDAYYGQPKIALDPQNNVVGINSGYTTEGGSGDEGSRVWSLKNNNALSGLIRFSQEADISIDSSGSMFAISSDEGRTEIWTTADESGKISRRLWIFHDGRKSPKAIFSSNNEYLLTCGSDLLIKLWKLPVPTVEPLEISDTESANDSTPQWEAIYGYLDDIKLDSSELYFRNNKTRKVSDKPLKHNSGVIAADFSQDGNYIASIAMKEACIWDRRTGKKLKNLSFTSDLLFAQTIKFSNNNEKLLVGSNYSVRVWDVTSGKVLTPFIKHPTIISHLDGNKSNAVFSRKGNLIVTSEFDSYKIWDASTGEPLSPLIEYYENDESAPAKSSDANNRFSRKGMSLNNLRKYSALMAGQTLDINSGFINLSGKTFMKSWASWQGNKQDLLE